jgi:N-acetylglucosamine-6-phosphate deacetylase
MRADRAVSTPTHPEWWLVPRTLFDGKTLADGRALRISAGRIAAITPAGEAGRDGSPVERVDSLVVPGYVDIQVNGGAGVLFNTSPDAAGLEAIGRAHRARGTTAFLPTVITDRAEVMEQAADAVIAAIGRFGVVGIHIEGPHISVERKGAHNPEFIRPFDERTWAVVEKLRQRSIPVLVTLAPERVPVEIIARLRSIGAVISLGHTAATAAQVEAALAAGATAVTHLYNGMSQMTSREPGVVGAAIDSAAYCGFIADGHHVSDSMLRIALRARPIPERMVLISDAMPTVGGPDSYSLYGETIRLVDGKLVNGQGSLAGVHIDMAQSVKRLVAITGIELQTALQTATSNPARMMGIENEAGFLTEGTPATFLLLNSLLECERIYTP